MTILSNFDHTNTVQYHYDAFPPVISPQEMETLFGTLLQTQDALSRYDQALMNLPSRQFFLGPLSRQEAVLSSRMEGTISTMDEVMLMESNTRGDDIKNHHHTVEVLCYAVALQAAQEAITQGAPINEVLIRATHQKLMQFGRGSAKSAGQYKTQQNYIANKRRKTVEFTPIAPEQLAPAIQRWIAFIEDENTLPLIRLAVGHLEFEALHPFDDGNGRIGRLLIPLLLWKYKLLNEPYFFISAYLDEHKEEYIDRMRAVSSQGDWMGWIKFFLEAVTQQSFKNLHMVQEIQALYESMKPEFREITSSKWAREAQDFMFSRPIFKNRQLTQQTGMPNYIAGRMTRLLEDSGILCEVQPSSGRRGAVYAFEPLMELIRV